MAVHKSKIIGFIGLGLIGGSIAKAIRHYHPDYRIKAYNRNDAVTRLAEKEGVIDTALFAVDAGFSDCDYIFLCTPVLANISYLSALKDIIKKECIVTDVGSVKGDIHRAVTRLGMEEFFIGGHPMAGSEKTGYANSADYLIENAYYILTKTNRTDPEALAGFEAFIASLKAVPMVLDYEAHDYITAYISHLPHVIASVLVGGMSALDDPGGSMRTIAAGGFKDITRIASSSPEMWRDICLANDKMILRVLDYYTDALQHARTLIEKGNGEALYRMFESSRDTRNRMTDKRAGTESSQYVIYCDIYDEAGGIATITTLLAMNNLSIKNIGITHNREFEEGVLRIEFYGDEARSRAATVLGDRNYTIHIRE